MLKFGSSSTKTQDLLTQQSGLGFVVFVSNKETYSVSGPIGITTSSLSMKVEAITVTLRWIESERPHSEHAVIATDSQSALMRIETRKMRSKRMRSIAATALRSLAWIDCPGQVGVQGNERAYSLAGDAKVTDNIKEDKAEILMRLSISLRGGEEREMNDHYSIIRMKELGIRKSEGRKYAAANEEQVRNYNYSLGEFARDPGQRNGAYMGVPRKP